MMENDSRSTIMTPTARTSLAAHLRHDFRLPALKDTNGSGYKVIGNEHYLEEKKKRPLSLTSIKDLRLVKEEYLPTIKIEEVFTPAREPTNNKYQNNNNNNNNNNNKSVINNNKISSSPTNHPHQQSDEKKRLRTLVLASAALAKFRQHATAKRKEKKINFSGSTSPRPGVGSGGIINSGGSLGGITSSMSEGKRLSFIEVDELFESMACRRYNKISSKSFQSKLG